MKPGFLKHQQSETIRIGHPKAEANTMNENKRYVVRWELWHDHYLLLANLGQDIHITYLDFSPFEFRGTFKS